MQFVLVTYYDEDDLAANLHEMLDRLERDDADDADDEFLQVRKLDDNPLEQTVEAAAIRLDGVFTNPMAKTSIGYYYLLEAKDLDEAAALAAKALSMAAVSSVEVWPVSESADARTLRAALQAEGHLKEESKGCVWCFGCLGHTCIAATFVWFIIGMTLFGFLIWWVMYKLLGSLFGISSFTHAAFIIAMVINVVLGIRAIKAVIGKFKGE